MSSPPKKVQPDTSTGECPVPVVEPAELVGQEEPAAVISPAEKAREAVSEFLRVVDSLPETHSLRELRDEFTEMNSAERTDEEFLSSPAFRNILKLAAVRCHEQPSKARVHIREVVDNMRLNTPKTPVSCANDPLCLNSAAGFWSF